MSLYILGQFQLSKLRPFAIQLNRLPGAAGLGFEKYATRRVERISAGLWAIRGGKQRELGEVRPLTRTETKHIMDLLDL